MRQKAPAAERWPSSEVMRCQMFYVSRSAILPITIPIHARWTMNPDGGGGGRSRMATRVIF